MKRKIVSIAVALGLLVGLMVVPAQAQPTPEVKEAIAKGVDWLANQQHADGYWGDCEQCAVTALAVKKLEHHAMDIEYGLGLPSPFHEDYPYREHVEKGLNWLLENCANTVDIGEQPAGDPDTDGDGIGVHFEGGRTYTTAIALMVLCEAVEMDREVKAGPLAGWTYKDVAVDTMDYLAFGQNDGGNERGGWGYFDNMVGWSDQSNTGYVALALGLYETAPPLGFGGTVPQFVKDELEIWVNYIQCDDGGSGYTGCPGCNILRTGNLLQELALIGATVDDERVQLALKYMCKHWYEPNVDPGWMGSPGGVASYQATFTAMKGLVSQGFKEKELPCGINWQADFEEVLLAQQNEDGSWPITIWDTCGNHILSTTWALLTLQKAGPDMTPPEVECIESVNPHGKKVPPAGSSTLPGKKGGVNEDGFYELIATDDVDPEPIILILYWDPEATAPDGSMGWWVALRDRDDPSQLFVLLSGTVVKFTQAPGATPSYKKIGSTKGQAGAVAWHITLPSEPVVLAVDNSGNMAAFPCFVPPPPK